MRIFLNVSPCRLANTDGCRRFEGSVLELTDPSVGNVLNCIPVTVTEQSRRLICSHTAVRTFELLNPLGPNDLYIRRTAQLTSRRCILNIHSTDILTEYFKHAAHSPFFLSLQDAVYFIMLSFLVPVIFTF